MGPVPSVTLMLGVHHKTNLDINPVKLVHVLEGYKVTCRQTVCSLVMELEFTNNFHKPKGRLDYDTKLSRIQPLLTAFVGLFFVRWVGNF